jgi:hypothetical protein
MNMETKNGEMNTNFFAVLLVIFLAIAAFLLYKNIISPESSEKTTELDFQKQEVINTETSIKPEVSQTPKTHN